MLRSGISAQFGNNEAAQSMIARKPLDLPPAVARAFVDDMRAYFAEENPIKRDGIALRQLHALSQQQGPRDKKLGLSEVAMFLQMRDQA